MFVDIIPIAKNNRVCIIEKMKDLEIKSMELKENYLIETFDSYYNEIIAYRIHCVSLDDDGNLSFKYVSYSEKQGYVYGYFAIKQISLADENNILKIMYKQLLNVSEYGKIENGRLCLY